MEKIRTQSVFLALILGGCLNLSAGGWEACVYSGGYTKGIQGAPSAQRLVACFSPSEFGLGSAFARPQPLKKDTPTVGVVPDERDCEQDDEEGDLLEVPVMTPSQDTAVAFSKFLLGSAEDFQAVREEATSSPAKRTRVDGLLEDLVDAAKNNPEYLKSALQANPEGMSRLRALLQDSKNTPVDEVSKRTRKDSTTTALVRSVSLGHDAQSQA